MALPAGRTAYKKKDGILTLTPDQQTVTWTPNTGGPAQVSLSVANVTNLQQTPDSAAKTMLKVFAKPSEGGEPVPYLFHFNTSEAKDEAKAVRDLLSRLLAEMKNSDPNVPTPNVGTPNTQANGNGGSGASGSMAFASAVNKSQQASLQWFDDSQLKNNYELQQSLMKKDPSLHRTYMEAMAMKPDTITGSAFNTQFWSTRINMLRAHAIETSQKGGQYNVLSTVRAKSDNGELKLNLTVEQIQMLLAQYPLIRRIYNENVPPRSDKDFWVEFFTSRLCTRLRGERVEENANFSPLFDKHDINENTPSYHSKIMAQNVPHIIDIEANEENQGGVRSGNKKDVEMRPSKHVAIVKTVNSVSERIMANVAPSDPNDEVANEAYTQLGLRDLRGPEEEHRIMLNVKEQNKLFAKRDAAPSSNAQVFAKQNPDDVLFDIQADLATLVEDGVGGLDLAAGIGFNDDSESDEEDNSPAKRNHVGSRSILRVAEKEILHGISQQRAQQYGHASDDTTPMGLSRAMADRCSLTHATTVEFLHQFWSAFLSGDPDRAAELQYLAESLAKSIDRINVVAEEATKEREELIKKRKQDIRDHYERTGKKIRWKSDMVEGGREAVIKLMQPVLDAIDGARSKYADALAAEGIKVSTES
ncbi:uncharacterized protein F5Z01DRAFT_666964 [Emericellopsis atlantica]|uniref:BSD domain-containing protein n=1 Tax=Emericellopsis atlantica TaxID=2614577 RepID=A0A9P7ZDQ2_9HYPO|nr:uncharacterized protein F5Z01DRAFT_666964 [Emericellopsis atlantica]KAG9250234.1 hypothetical protein F5Z01DRAFT_666964 [Emericellopsis atlantica]